MSQKRKFEEYHDPDYPQDLPPDTKKTKVNDAEPSPPTERAEKIRTIVRREFERELNQKEQELSRIEHKLLQAKRLLQRVRYAVVFSYYTKKNLEYSESEQRNELTMNSASSETVVVSNPADTTATPLIPIQKAVHPSLKKLLGKKTIDYNEILKIRPARQAAKDAKTSISEKLRSKKDERKLRMAPTETVTRHADDIKIPRYISPTKVERPIDKINMARGRNQTRHLIAVGNTSKYVGDDKSQQGVTHKWLVYVKTKTEEASVEDVVTKVRFFLHPSYKPNDVVDVDSSPFQISRRGWGEFPIRVQLYFHAHIQQKPLQIIHNLVLDKKLTGLQTMGAETVVEMWLKLSPGIEPTTTFTKEDSPKRAQLLAVGLKSITPKKTPTSPQKNGRNSVESWSSVSTVSFKCEKEVGINNQFGNFSQVEAIPENLFGDNVINDALWDHESVINPEFSNRSFSQIVSKENGNIPFSGIDPNTGQTPEVKTELIDGPTLKVEETIPDTISLAPAPSFAMTPPATPVAVCTSSVVKCNPSPAPLATIPKTPPRKFMKCLDSNGKVIVVEIKVDPNNPKNFKIIKNPTQTTKPLIKLNHPGIAASIQPIKLAPMTIKIEPNHNTSTSSVQSTIDIKTTQQGRLIIIPKSPITLNGSGSTSTTSVSPKPPTSSTPILISQPHPSILPPNHLIRVPSATVKKTTVAQIPPNLIKPNNVIMRNGKMFIIDPTKVVPKSVLTPSSKPTNPPTAKPPNTQTVKTPNMQTVKPPNTPTATRPYSAAKPKQQSLLKPQISLLKPRPAPGSVVPAKLQAPPSLNIKPIGVFSQFQRSIKLVKNLIPSAAGGIIMRPPLQLELKPKHTITNGAGLRPIVTQTGRLLQLPAVVMPPEKSVFNSSNNVNKFIISHTRTDYMRDLEQQFFGRRHFRNIRNAVEFLLKHVPIVHRLAATRNTDFQQVFPFTVGSMATFDSLLLPKKRSIEWSRAKFINRLLHKHQDLQSSPPWSTKDVVLYARCFGHTPPCVFDSAQPASAKRDPSESSQSKLSALIKNEMKREQSQYETISLNVRINDWLTGWNQPRSHRRLTASDDVVINVEDEDDAPLVPATENTADPRPKVWMALDSKLQAESSLVTELCHSMQVKLQPEEICSGVTHPSAHLMLVTAMQSFVTDLIRRAYATKTDKHTKCSNGNDQLVTAEDIRKATSLTGHFDFLTNRYFGTDSVKAEPSAK